MDLIKHVENFFIDINRIAEAMERMTLKDEFTHKSEDCTVKEVTSAVEKMPEPHTPPLPVSWDTMEDAQLRAFCRHRDLPYKRLGRKRLLEQLRTWEVQSASFQPEAKTPESVDAATPAEVEVKAKEPAAEKTNPEEDFDFNLGDEPKPQTPTKEEALKTLKELSEKLGQQEANDLILKLFSDPDCGGFRGNTAISKMDPEYYGALIDKAKEAM